VQETLKQFDCCTKDSSKIHGAVNFAPSAPTQKQADLLTWPYGGEQESN
jgi:hypothetical protein